MSAGCESNTDCESKVCQSGVCLASETIVYVATDGDDDPNCGILESPCLSIEFSAKQTSATRPILLLGFQNKESPLGQS